MTRSRFFSMLMRATCAIIAVAPIVNAQGGSPASAASSQQASYTQADVRFMQGMIGHHAQALEMAALVPDHTANKAIHLLAERIEVSQKDEIGMMRRWLETRHESAPNPLAKGQASEMAAMSMPGMSSATLMPGMLTPAQIKQLSDAHGNGFDRLFLTFMIQHHTGALTMVKDLFASPGAGQEPEAFRFASDVDTDQRAEITRMQSLLATLPKSPK
jgi:uncharacterized protein (DUF305 family)